MVWAFAIAELGWLLLVTVGGALVSLYRQKRDADIRALNLPRGSIRAMLALTIVGSFVIFLVFAPFMCTGECDVIDKVIVAFGTLSGAVTGFYFGGRASAAPGTTNGTQ